MDPKGSKLLAKRFTQRDAPNSLPAKWVVFVVSETVPLKCVVSLFADKFSLVPAWAGSGVGVVYLFAFFRVVWMLHLIMQHCQHPARQGADRSGLL